MRVARKRPVTHARLFVLLLVTSIAGSRGAHSAAARTDGVTGSKLLNVSALRNVELRIATIAAIERVGDRFFRVRATCSDGRVVTLELNAAATFAAKSGLRPLLEDQVVMLKS